MVIRTMLRARAEKTKAAARYVCAVSPSSVLFVWRCVHTFTGTRRIKGQSRTLPGIDYIIKHGAPHDGICRRRRIPRRLTSQKNNEGKKTETLGRRRRPRVLHTHDFGNGLRNSHNDLIFIYSYTLLLFYREMREKKVATHTHTFTIASG